MLQLSFGNAEVHSDFQNQDCHLWNELQIPKGSLKIQNHFSDTLKHFLKKSTELREQTIYYIKKIEEKEPSM